MLRSQSHVGMRHRDHAVTGNTLKSMNTGLAEYFFGPGLDQKLTFQRFLTFQRQLQREILNIEVTAARHPTASCVIVESNSLFTPQTWSRQNCLVLSASAV